METQTKEENQAIVDEMVRDAESAPEPGLIATEKVISDGAETSMPMVASKLTSAGYVYIYDTVTHEPSLTNRNMLTTQLKKKRPDGSNVFTTHKPKEKPFKGALKCMLHEDNPERAHYNELGLPTCRKSNLTAPFHVMRHMQTRHKMEWGIIEKEAKDIKEAEDRAFQRSMITMASTGAPEEKAPLYVSDKPAKPKEKKKRRKTK